MCGIAGSAIFLDLAWFICRDWLVRQTSTEEPVFEKGDERVYEKGDDEPFGQRTSIARCADVSPMTDSSKEEVLKVNGPDSMKKTLVSVRVRSRSVWL